MYACMYYERSSIFNLPIQIRACAYVTVTVRASGRLRRRVATSQIPPNTVVSADTRKTAAASAPWPLVRLYLIVRSTDLLSLLAESFAPSLLACHWHVYLFLF